MGSFTRGIIAGVVLVLFCVAAFSAFRFGSEAQTIGAGITAFSDLEERFEKLAEAKGALYAFDVLRRAQLPPNTDLHLLGHVVGDALYAQEGIAGIARCTQEFRNACSHSIVIGALNEFGGEAALKMIRDACRAAPGGSGAYTMCYHGLGHGVFAFYDYSLPETVELCSQTGTEAYRHREAVECIGGAVMELSGGGGHNRMLWEKARERYLQGPLDPCLSLEIPEHSRSQCLIYITPEIWRAAGIDLGRPDPALFAKAFASCEELRNEDHRKACFGGFGKEFVPLALARDIREIDAFAEQESRMVSAWCAQASSADGTTACIRHALQSLFWGGENDPAIAFRFCSFVQEEQKDPCYDELAQAIRQYLPQERALCTRLPQAHRDTCEVRPNEL